MNQSYLAGKKYPHAGQANTARALQVYLAGKVQLDNRSGKWRIQKFVPRDIATFFSSDGRNHSMHGDGVGVALITEGDDELRPFVQQEVVNRLRQADMLIAYLETPDSTGSIAEIAYMSALSRPSYVFIKDPNRRDPDVSNFLDSYWLVCKFPWVTPKYVHSIHDYCACAHAVITREHERRREGSI